MFPRPIQLKSMAGGKWRVGLGRLVVLTKTKEKRRCFFTYREMTMRVIHGMEGSEDARRKWGSQDHWVLRQEGVSEE